MKNLLDAWNHEARTSLSDWAWKRARKRRGMPAVRTTGPGFGVFLAACLAAPLLFGVAGGAEPPAGGALAFRAGSSNEFTFDTGILTGKFRPGGSSRGLAEVTHVATRTRIDSSHGLAGLYRVLAENKRYGDAWDWKSQAALNEDGSVTVVWGSAKDRPFALEALYRWSEADTLDVMISVKPEAPLKKFEVFMASYFSVGFTNAAIWAHSDPRTQTGSVFVRTFPQHGTWQAFPRDDSAFAIVKDGRWTYPPSPVDWLRVANYTRPLAFRRDNANDLAAAVMANAKDCFAVLAPFETEKHRSLYLSLFGQDASPEQPLRAMARLVISRNLTDGAAIRLFRDFAMSSAAQAETP
jgi:hypothetical protein